MANRPEPEVDVTEALVRSLLSDQCPHLAELPLRSLSRGWDNTNWRLADDAIVRIPHRQAAVELIRMEQRWLGSLAQRITLPIPAPTFDGKPTDVWPWPWSITPYFAGTEAASAAIDQGRAAMTLATFLRQLHISAPGDAPLNRFRGCPLGDRSDAFRSNLAAVDSDLDAQMLETIFERACAAPHEHDRVWLHGDLHTRNMIVTRGDLTAVIDWGDMCAGDPATDLAGAFMLVPDHIALVKEHAGADEHAWERAQGWAANFAAVYLAHSDDDPVMGRIGQDLVRALSRQ